PRRRSRQPDPLPAGLPGRGTRDRRGQPAVRRLAVDGTLKDIIMRISTGMMFDNGTTGLLDNQSTLFKLQNQMSTGRRVLTPSDDPVASAQALVATQSQSVNQQYMDNQGSAKSQLGLVEGNLDSLTSLLQDIRERAVQLGNASLTDRERGYIESEFKSRFEE